MKVYETDKLRNLIVAGHRGAGKTSLVEGMLFATGGSTRLGRVEEGTSTCDYSPEEIDRKISIQSALAYVESDGCKINLIDTPGFGELLGEVISAIAAADALLLVLDATGGVEVMTEQVWNLAQAKSAPSVAFVNKLDKENTDFNASLAQLKKTFEGVTFAPAIIPMGTAADFKGVIDVLGGKAYTFAGGKETEGPVPAEYADAMATAKEALTEAAAEGDDDLLEKYLEAGELTEAELLKGLGAAVAAGKVCLVFGGSAYNNSGTLALLKGLVKWIPSPDKLPAIKATKVNGDTEVELAPSGASPLTALVFKTIVDPVVGRVSYLRVFTGELSSDVALYNASKSGAERLSQILVLKGKNQDTVVKAVAGDIVATTKLDNTETADTLCAQDNQLTLARMDYPEPFASLAINCANRADEEKVSDTLNKLQKEDPSFRAYRDHETEELLVAGLGSLHLDVIIDKLRRRSKVEVETTPPKVAYRETIRKRVEVEGKHKKQTGGRGQFGHVWIRFEPLPRGSGFEFEDAVVGGSVPRQFIPAVEKGLLEVLPKGVLAGFPTVDIKATLYDGSSHPVDSSELAFKLAAHLAFKKGIMEADPVLLEPISYVEVTVPEEFMGDVMGDFNGRRGRILGMEPQGNKQIVKAMVPLSELGMYSADLTSKTGGKGHFMMRFDHYDEVPAHLVQHIIEQHKKDQEEAE